MKDIIKEFLKLYINSSNAFLVIAGAMLLVFLIYFILFFFGGSSLKKINKVLRKETGEDIIKKIEALRLSKRFNRMWDDYYVAYISEDTVSLSKYLIKNDLFKGRNIFPVISRAIALIGFSVTAAGIIKISGLLEAEKANLYCLFFVLLSLEVFLEIFYTFMDDLRKKRFSRLLEEFELLSMRKLPGKAVSFEQRHIINKLNDLEERLNNVKIGVNQLNARMDRQYNLLNKDGENK